MHSDRMALGLQKVNMTGRFCLGSQDPVNIRNNSNSGKDFFSSGQQVRQTVNFQFQQPKR